MAICVINIHKKTVCFANDEFVDLTLDLALSRDILALLVADAVEVNAGCCNIKDIIVTLANARFPRSNADRLGSLDYVPLGNSRGEQFLMVVDGNEEIFRSLASRTLGQNYLDLALEANGIGAWSLDIVNNKAQRTARHDEIFGYLTAPVHWDFEIFEQHVVEEDRPLIREKFERAAETAAPWQFQCRIRKLDGQLRWIEASGRPHGVSGGITTHYIGLVKDITNEIIASEQRRILLAELHHRVRNNLAVVQSLVSHTLSVPETVTTREMLMSRIQSLTPAHEFLACSRSSLLELNDVVAAVISHAGTAVCFEATNKQIYIPLHHFVPLYTWLCEIVANFGHSLSIIVSPASDGYKIKCIAITENNAWRDILAKRIVLEALPLQMEERATHSLTKDGCLIELECLFDVQQTADFLNETITATTMLHDKLGLT